MNALDDILSPALKTFTLTEIAAMARINYSHLRDVRRGRRPETADMLQRVGVAVRRLKYRHIDVKLQRDTVYFLLLHIASKELGLDPVMVRNSDPRAKMAANQQWRDASKARWIAQYLMNTKLDMPQAHVARVTRVSKQAVSLAMGAMEMRRDDPDLDALLMRLEDIFPELPSDAQ